MREVRINSHSLPFTDDSLIFGEATAGGLLL